MRVARLWLIAVAVTVGVAAAAGARDVAQTETPKAESGKKPYIDPKALKKLGITESEARELLNKLILDTDADPDEGSAPLTVHFKVSADEKVASPKYRWDFDDGTTSEEQNPTHIYKKPGTYSVTVKVWDAKGPKKGKDTLEIDVDQPGE